MKAVIGAVFALAMGVAAFGVEAQASAVSTSGGDGQQLVRCGGPNSVEAPTLWLAACGTGGGGSSGGGGSTGGGDSGGTGTGGGGGGGGGGAGGGGARSR